MVRTEITRVEIPIQNELLKEGERLDDLQRNDLRIIQNRNVFCFGMDAVLLSAFSQVREQEKVIDLGTGNGVIPLLLSARTKAGHITGLEIQQQSADMAQRSVLLNHLEDRIEIIRGDIREAEGIFPAASFDVVTSNPPYMTSQHGLLNPKSAKAIARHEICCSLEDVCRAAAFLLLSGGRFYMVHRPFRLAEIIRALSRYHLEPKRMRLVYPFADKEPNMVLIESVRGGRPRITVEKPLIIYEEPGKYTEEVRKLYYE